MTLMKKKKLEMISTEMTYDFFAAGRDQHPADDETAKWKLEYLFKENLKAPTFLGIEYTSSLNDSEM
ncbi:unnamed protein product [Rhizophagus irregularis]|nr:unnamed protein product [Rhizophagus irregularis]